jgi:hypothetical protein
MADMKMNDYETRERKFINWFIDLKLEHKLDEVSPIGSGNRSDFVMISGNTYILGEVKIRDIEWNKYPTAVIELDKINALMNIFQPFYQMGKNHNKLYYFAAYPKSRKVLVFDIINTPTTLTYEYCPITTAYDRGNKYKAMVNYKLTDAVLTINY